MPQCVKCFATKPAADFGYRAVHVDGAAAALVLRGECLTCRAERLAQPSGKEKRA